MSANNTVTFSGTGNGPVMSIPDRRNLSYALTGSFTATLVLEYSRDGGQTWQNAGVTLTAADSGTIQANHPAGQDTQYRWRCSAFTSGSPVGTITLDPKVLAEWKDDFGNVVFQITETGITVGDLAVLNQLSVAADVETTSGIGSSAASGVTVAEKGNGVIHKTVLTCTAVSLGAFGDEGAQGQFAGVNVYDFPEGMINIQGIVIDGSITLAAPAIDAWDGDIGIGVEAPTDHQDAANKAGSVMPTVATTQAVSKVANVDSQSVVAAQVESGGRWLDGTTTAINFFLNLLVDDDVAHDDTITGTFTGVISFIWTNLGDN